MIIGCLGDVQFQVSERTVLTLNNFSWSKGANYAEHARHNTNPIVEYTGMEVDSIKFDITLSTLFGVSVLRLLQMISDFERDGVLLPLVIGTTVYGKYRWVIHSHSIKTEHYDGHGNIIDCTVTLNLIEYRKINDSSVKTNDSSKSKPMRSR